MASVYVPAMSSASVQAPRSLERSHTDTESGRLARRASLRSCTRSLLRELNEQHDHSADPDARALVTLRMRELRDELVAALRGDAAAIEALSVKSREPRVQ